MSVGNATVEIEVGSPLLRPGLTIKTKTSEAYSVNAAKSLVNLAREINKNEGE